MNQPQETRDLYTENYETLMNEIKDDTNRWKDISCCWMRRIPYFHKKENKTLNLSFKKLLFNTTRIVGYESCSVMSDSLQPHRLSPWNSPGQNTGVGSLSLLQGISPTQESNRGLLHYRRILNQLRRVDCIYMSK